MTAEEFLEENGDKDFRLSISGEYVSDMMIEFAKHHVQEALKEANKTLDDDQLFYLSSGCINLKNAHEDILSCYPLENIK